MNKIIKSSALGLGALVFGTVLGGTAVSAQEERNACLMHSQIDDMIQVDDNRLILLVDGGTTVYLLDLDSNCFSGQVQPNLSLRPAGSDGCVRTTDTVVYGRHDCRIRDFTLVETQDELDAVLASLD